MTLSRAKLTPEEDEFYRLMLMRATSDGIGQPYLSYALFELTPISAPGLGTQGVDKHWRLYIDFEFMMEKGIEYASKVLNHEPWHLLRDHPHRFENLDIRKDGQAHNSFAWNLAGDLTINGDIVDLVPDDGVFPGKGQFKNYKFNDTTENYYFQLLEDEDFKPKDDKCPECGKSPSDKQDSGDQKDQKQDKGDKPDKGDQDGNESGDQQDGDQSGDEDGDDQGNGGQGDQDGDQDGDQQGNGSGNGQDGKDGQGQGGSSCSTCDGHGNRTGSGSGQGGFGQGVPNPQCGSGAGNKLKDYELGEDEAKAVDAERAEQIRQATAEAVKQYAQSNPGSMPGGLEVWADQTLKAPAPDWRQVLRGSLKQAISWKRGQLDYNRSRRNRRQPNPNIITPALMAPRPRIAVGVDTSGSHLHKLGVVSDQIVEIAKKVGVRNKELMAFGVDVEAKAPVFVANPEKAVASMTGGGGTDMRVAYEVFSDLDRQNKADISILLTDLQTDWPKERPAGKMRHIVCGIVDSRQAWEMDWVTKAEAAIGDWATVIIIDVAEGTDS